MSRNSAVAKARREYHAALLSRVLRLDRASIPTNADKDNRHSVDIARAICRLLGAEVRGTRLAGQMSGNQFEEITAAFVEATFPKLDRLRPGRWDIIRVRSRDRLAIAKYDQFAHLTALEAAARRHPDLAVALGNDYTITPDVVIARHPEPDSRINRRLKPVVDASIARQAAIRKVVQPNPLLHATISCNGLFGVIVRRTQGQKRST